MISVLHHSIGFHINPFMSRERGPRHSSGGVTRVSLQACPPSLAAVVGCLKEGITLFIGKAAISVSGCLLTRLKPPQLFSQAF